MIDISNEHRTITAPSRKPQYVCTNGFVETRAVTSISTRGVTSISPVVDGVTSISPVAKGITFILPIPDTLISD